jgi:homoserine kinase
LEDEYLRVESRGATVFQGPKRANTMNSIAIKVPASTSNLGSGFDTLGLAVNLYTTVAVERAASPGVQLCSEAVELSELLSEAASAFFRSTGVEPFGIKVQLAGNVPIARGLGYSATLRVGILAALNELAEGGLGKEQLLQLASQLEHHPDNASPSIFGGFTVSGLVNGEIRCLHFPVPESLKLVVLVPNVRISTEQARKLMPASYSKVDAAHGLNRAALITAAFSSGRFEALRGLFDDRIHQPYREPLIPKLGKAITNGEAAGAVGGFLSGSGSAIICLALQTPEGVGAAMRRALPDSQILILTADNAGFTLS